jgi:peptidoglycan-associated lipoprotein
LGKAGRLSLFVLSIALVVMASGCKKKVAPPIAPAPPAAVAAAPTAKITATPSSVTAGDAVVLDWSTTDATDVSIEGIGTVSATGSKTITPASSVSYRLTAKGPGGSTDAVVRVTVNPRPVIAAPKPDADAEFQANVKDIFFDYDKYSVGAEADAVLAKDAAFLLSHPDTKIVIGGYCDERGSNEYNLALGQNRANSAKEALIKAGVKADQIRTVSYGKEKPFCTEATEACWQQNRRAGFTREH